MLWFHRTSVRQSPSLPGLAAKLSLAAIKQGNGSQFANAWKFRSERYFSAAFCTSLRCSDTVKVYFSISGTPIGLRPCMAPNLLQFSQTLKTLYAASGLERLALSQGRLATACTATRSVQGSAYPAFPELKDVDIAPVWGENCNVGCASCVVQHPYSSTSLRCPITKDANSNHDPRPRHPFSTKECLHCSHLQCTRYQKRNSALASILLACPITHSSLAIGV